MQCLCVLCHQCRSASPSVDICVLSACAFAARGYAQAHSVSREFEIRQDCSHARQARNAFLVIAYNRREALTRKRRDSLAIRVLTMLARGGTTMCVRRGGHWNSNAARAAVLATRLSHGQSVGRIMDSSQITNVSAHIAAPRLLLQRHLCVLACCA